MTQLDQFMAKYTPEIQKLARAAMRKMRKRLPTAVQLVYDNYNALVIGFGSTDRASDAVFSIALYPRWVTLFFLDGATLPDPRKLLRGSGKHVRHIVLQRASDIDEPAVEALIAASLKRHPIETSQRGRLVVKSVSAKQRPRRPRA